jgi:16S rRNA (adenine1518-N6/adenine1519-N6)-dimethyltransferase
LNVQILPSDTLPFVSREADSRRRAGARTGRRGPREAAGRAFLPARKRWGQHFLASAQTADRIVDAARVGRGDTVVEVGPGDGALTRPLLARGARVLAIEIDPARAEALRGELGTGSGAVILAGDALERSFADWLAAAGWEGPAILVANLPYNVATPILTRAIEEPRAVARVVATVQREVARRVAAVAGDDEYGFLSVRAAASASATILFDIPPGAFRPRPKVVSSVLALMPRDPPLDPLLKRRALEIASLGFRNRRKTLGNALAALGPREAWERELRAMGRGEKSRAEELSLPDFLELARRLPAGGSEGAP